MTKFNWIHFGDLHWSTGDTDRRFQNIEELLLDDLRHLNKKTGGIDVVICSGDIVLSGTSDQYEQATKIIEKISSVIAEDAQPPYFFAVPGNHDIERPSNPMLATLAIKDLVENTPKIWKDLWSTEETEGKSTIQRAFKNYGEWYQNLSQSHPHLSNIDPVFRDHSGVIYKEGYRIGLLGLNSTFLQLSSGNYKGKLAIDLQQVANICDDSLSRWASHNHLNLLVTHHPSDWLSNRSKDLLTSEIYSPPNRFFAHLFGHMHRSSITTTSVGGSSPRRYFQTPSLFSDEPWGEPPRNERIHGFLVGQMRISERSAQYRLWPRLATKLDSGGRKFSPDTSYDLVKDKPFTNWHTLELLRSGKIPRISGDGFGPTELKDREEAVSNDTVLTSDFNLNNVFRRTYQSNPVHLNRLLSSSMIKSKGEWTLTQLQENFLKFIDDVSSPYQDIIISGGTSSGKTTLAEASFGIAKPHALDTARIIYLAPTRALAQERYREWVETYSSIVSFDRNSSPVIVSTGDDHADDSALQRGDFFLACLVYEKANVLFSSTPEFLRNINLVIVDELHMIEDWQRGSVVESILAKISYEKERRSGALDQKNPLRVLGITTDSVDKEHIAKAFSYRDSSDFNSHPAVVVSTNIRPRAIQYSFVTMLSGHEKTYSVQEFRKFEADEPILVLPEEASKAVKNFASVLTHRDNSNFAGGSRFNAKSVYTNTMREFVLDWLITNPTGSRLLVFIHTKEISYELGAMIKNALKRANLFKDVPPSESLQIIVNRFFEPDLAANLLRLKDLFQQGVLVHNADLSRDLREKTEEHLKSPLPSEARSEVIFATETLSYGVNLQIDDVLFGSLSFPSSQRKASEGFGPKRLTKNAFTNMAGRAGRINQSSKEPTVYILVNPHMEDSISGIIQQYFVEPSSFESSLFHPRDGLAARDVEEGSVPVTLAAQELSYPFVRTVLDGLRFLGGMPGRAGALGRSGATETDVFNRYLSRTVFWQQFKGNTPLQNLINFALRSVLESSATEDFKLVSSHLGKPRITRLGASVIDTGTEIETVVPLRTALRKLFSLWSELNGDDVPMPYILYLLPIIFQEESHRRFISECPEVKFTGEWKADANLQDLCDRIANRIAAEDLRYCAQTISSVLKEFRNWTITSQPLNGTSANYEMGAHDACLRLFLGLWDWTNGKALSEVLAEMSKTYSTTDVREAEVALNLTALAETLNWKILFTAELMNSMQTTMFDPVVSADAARLSLRVRLGCVEEAIPILFRRRSDSPIVSRSEANDILAHGHLCSDIVSGRADLSEFLDPARERGLRGRITDFVNHQFKEMAATFTLAGGTSSFEEVADEIWRVSTENVKSLARLEQTKLKSISSALSSSVELSDETRRIHDEKQDVEVSVEGDCLKFVFGRKRAVERTDVKIERYDAYIMLATFSTEDVIVGADVDLVLYVDFPWLLGRSERGSRNKVVRMSPASFGVFLSLMSRNLLSDNIQALQVIGERSNIGYVSARQLMRVVSSFLKEDTPEVLMTAWAKYVEISERL